MQPTVVRLPVRSTFSAPPTCVVWTGSTAQVDPRKLRRGPGQPAPRRVVDAVGRNPREAGPEDGTTRMVDPSKSE